MPRKRKSKKMMIDRAEASQKWRDWRTLSDDAISENERMAYRTGFNMGWKASKRNELSKDIEHMG